MFAITAWIAKRDALSRRSLRSSVLKPKADLKFIRPARPALNRSETENFCRLRHFGCWLRHLAVVTPDRATLAALGAGHRPVHRLEAKSLPIPSSGAVKPTVRNAFHMTAIVVVTTGFPSSRSTSFITERIRIDPHEMNTASASA
jgi:hypothetical protein